VALALLADATGFGPRTTVLALALSPVLLFLGISTHVRLVREADRLAMNRLRHAYLKIAPSLTPNFTAGHHDDHRNR